MQNNTQESTTGWTMTEPSGRGMSVTRPIGAVAVLLLVAAMVVAAANPALAASKVITSSGPLNEIEITDDLNCRVEHVDDTASEFYGGTACGTLVAAGGTLYGPADIPAGGSASPRTAFTPVSQSDVTGSGTASDPYRIVTVVALGDSGLRITQTDSYVVGQESYRTDVSLQNTTGNAVDAIVYRAGDCYLQNSDSGFGSVSPEGAVACVAPNAEGTGPGDRIQQWYPLTAGSRYYEAWFSEVWSWIGSQRPFPNTCRCNELVDNGAGLSWSLSLAAAGTSTVSHLTTFSPLGVEPLTTAKTAASGSTPASGDNAYTIVVSNPNAEDVELTSIVDTLPAGFSYRPGTTTGATTSDPAVSGQELTWSGPFTVPGGGSVSLAFGVTVSSTPGTYYNQASATSSVAVVPTGETAPIAVTEVEPTNSPPSVDAGPDVSGEEGAPIALDGTVSDPDGDTLTTVWTASDPGCSFVDASAVDTSLTCTTAGVVTVTLTAADGHNEPVSDTAQVTVIAAPPGGECVDLIAGRSMDVGDVCIEVSGEMVTVTYSTVEGWMLSRTHLHAAVEPADVPQTRPRRGQAYGNPIPGRFDHQRSHEPLTATTTYTFAVPETDGEWVVAAHADVTNTTTDPVSSEGAWAEGERFVNHPGTWAMYVTVNDS